MKTNWFTIICVTLAMLTSCQGNSEQQQQQVVVDDAQLKASLEKANRYMANDEEEDILNYIERNEMDVITTGTGLRYQIIKRGEGDTIQQGQTVIMEYVLCNVMGDEIYSSDNDGVMSFVVGYGNVVSGLNEAIRHLHKGDIAKVIIPSHLGYGLVGDQKEISGRCTLIYTLKILEVN